MMQRTHAVALAMFLLAAAPLSAKAQDDAKQQIVDIFSHGSTAIGVTASGGGAYDYLRGDQNGSTYATSSSQRMGIGIEARRMFGSEMAFALTGEYVTKGDSGGPNEGYRGTFETDLFLGGQNVKPYFDGSLGLTDDFFDDFTALNLDLGVGGGVFIRTGQNGCLGLGYNYILGGSSITSAYSQYSSTTPPELYVRPHGQFRARYLLFLF